MYVFLAVLQVFIFLQITVNWDGLDGVTRYHKQHLVIVAEYLPGFGGFKAIETKWQRD